MEFQEPISFRCKDYMLSYQNIPPHRLKMHFHGMYEMLWIMHGDASYMIEDTTYRLSEGDIIFTRPNELHTIIFHSDEAYERCFLQFSPSFANFLNAGLTSVFDKLSPQGNIIPAKTADKYDLYHYFREIAECTVNTPPFWHTAAHAQLTLLIIKLNEIFSSNAVPNTYTASADRIDKVAEYLAENTNVTLDELAAKFYMNKYHLCHAFKKRFGLTIKEFVNTRRLAKAKQLIEAGHSITELCYLCGFNDYTTFYKTFKKLTGQTPSDFFANLRTEHTL